MRSASPLFAVRKMTGVGTSAGIWRICRQSSSPSFPGTMMSRMNKDDRLCNEYAADKQGRLHARGVSGAFRRMGREGTPEKGKYESAKRRQPRFRVVLRGGCWQSGGFAQCIPMSHALHSHWQVGAG